MQCTRPMAGSCTCPHRTDSFSSAQRVGRQWLPFTISRSRQRRRSVTQMVVVAAAAGAGVTSTPLMVNACTGKVKGPAKDADAHLMLAIACVHTYALGRFRAAHIRRQY